MTATASLDAVEAAAVALVEAFASGDSDRYFACFSPDATFLFHTEPGLLADRPAYEQRWAAWEADGFAVLGCRSFDRHVTMPTPDIGIFTHRVRTTLAGEEGESAERETIVFHRCGAEWVAVHEHLSPDPDPAEPNL